MSLLCASTVIVTPAMRLFNNPILLKLEINRVLNCKVLLHPRVRLYLLIPIPGAA